VPGDGGTGQTHGGAHRRVGQTANEQSIPLPDDATHGMGLANTINSFLARNLGATRAIRAE
jgi:hypothetical protein